MINHHILFTAWEYPRPGVKGNPYLASRARTLAKHGFKVTLLHIGFSNPLKAWSSFLEFRNLKNEEQKYGIKVIYIPSINLFPTALFGTFGCRIQKKLLFVIAWFRLKRYIFSNGKPEVIHHHFIANGTPYLTEFISRTLNIPYVISEHSSAAASVNYLRKKAGHFYSEQDLVRFVKNAKACTAKIQQYADIFTNVYSRKFSVIPNPIPYYFVDKQLPPFPKSQKNGFYFIAVGDINANKSHSRLIRAFAKSFGNKNGIYLRIAGNGPFRGQVEKLIEELNMNKQVELLGYTPYDKVRDFMDKSHAVVISSEREILSSTIVEGWFRGLPTVSTDCGVHPDVIKAENGLICRKDVDDLAEKLQYMYSNYSMYDSKAIIKHASEEYSEEAIIKRFSEVYNEATA